MILVFKSSPLSSDAFMNKIRALGYLTEISLPLTLTLSVSHPHLLYMPLRNVDSAWEKLAISTVLLDIVIPVLFNAGIVTLPIELSPKG